MKTCPACKSPTLKKYQYIVVCEHCAFWYIGQVQEGEDSLATWTTLKDEIEAKAITKQQKEETLQTVETEAHSVAELLDEVEKKKNDLEARLNELKKQHQQAEHAYQEAERQRRAWGEQLDELKEQIRITDFLINPNATKARDRYAVQWVYSVEKDILQVKYNNLAAPMPDPAQILAVLKRAVLNNKTQLNMKEADFYISLYPYLESPRVQVYTCRLRPILHELGLPPGNYQFRLSYDHLSYKAPLFYAQRARNSYATSSFFPIITL